MSAVPWYGTDKKYGWCERWVLVRSQGHGVDIFMRETHALCHLPWLILVSETAWRREILGVDDQASTSLPST